MRVRLFSDIGHVMTKANCLLGLIHMMMYERLKPATSGPIADTYLDLKMLCLFYFALESEKMAVMSGLKWNLKKILFSLFSCFFISIPNVN